MGGQCWCSLGLDRVDPIYYDPIKVWLHALRGLFLHIHTHARTYTDIIHIPAISGYRKRQIFIDILLRRFACDNLFYLDPHHARPAVPLSPLPPYVGESVDG